MIYHWSTLSLYGIAFTAYKGASEVTCSELLCTLNQTMEQVNFQQSLKNIPVPENRSYLELLILSMDKTIKAFRNKAIPFLKKSSSKSKETFGLKSINNPDAVPELRNFENDFINLAKNIQFKKFDNNLQRNLRRICSDIQGEPKLIIPADKTHNFYKLTPKEHQDLRVKDVQNCYKKEKKEALEKVKKDHQKLAKKLNISDRLFRTSKQECFITIKDHKSNFRENTKVRTLNPAKPEIGKVSKRILDDKLDIIRKKSKLNQWKNSKSAIDWFRNLKNKKKLKFILFDVENFYPSIDESLLKKSIDWANQFVEFSEDDMEVIIASRKATLFMDGEPWSKKGGGIFDVGMGFYDGAEICELVGLFLLNELQELGINLGIYRDDGLAVSEKTAREVENLKKKMSAIFKKYNLKITIEANKKRVEFLDLYFDLEKQEYGPYMKPNSKPIYVSSESNHPPRVLENIPKGVNKRLSTISANKEIFDKAAPPISSCTQ